MTAPTYRDLILESIDGLPAEALAEIAGYVSFVRRRVLQPRAFEDELRAALLALELKQLSGAEEAHLEEEFANYDQLHPRE